MLQVSIYRYNPETDAEPRMEEFQVDTGGKDVMVLDVLEQIKAEQDSSVTYRRSCREGVCGSDGLNMNGKKGFIISTINRPAISRRCCYQKAGQLAQLTVR